MRRARRSCLLSVGCLGAGGSRGEGRVVDVDGDVKVDGVAARVREGVGEDVGVEDEE
jgi:hypothetical protein